MKKPTAAALAWRLAPILTVLTAAGLFVARAEDSGPYVLRNLLPLLGCAALFGIALVRNRATWFGYDRRWPLASIGFALPTLGLSLYLHASWYYDFDGIASGARTPDLLFRFLPYYTLTAGLIGFAIGWIIGKNVQPSRGASA